MVTAVDSNGTRQSAKKNDKSSFQGDSSHQKSRRRSLLDSSAKKSAKDATERRKSRLGGQSLAAEMAAAEPAAEQAEQSSLILDPEQVSALYQQCIKLATENKITAKNTWALGLIDHLHDLVSEPEGSGTNFQKASITLGAGIEIYSKRVDSVHSAAYKVLSGLSKRGGLEDDDDQDNEGEEGTQEGEEASQNTKAARRAAILRDVNPSSTLEPNFESLNVKKFDLAFAVDPLFQQTSAQFDEGGARGLLLANLSVFNGCEILFDSQEVPKRAQDSQQPPSTEVDLEPLREGFEAAERAAQNGARVCPALDQLYSMLGQPPEAHYAEEIAQLMCSLPKPSAGDETESMVGDDIMEMMEEFGHETLSSDGDEAFQDALDGNDFDAARLMEEDGPAEVEDPPDWFAQQQQSEALDPDSQGHSADAVTSSEGLGAASNNLLEEDDIPETSGVEWLISGVENLNLEGKAWAGASHWRFRPRGKENVEPNEAAPPPKRTKKEKAGPIDFNNLPPLPEGILKPANLKDITLKNWPSKANTLLPPDRHYKVSQLSELFLVPGIPFYELAAFKNRMRQSRERAMQSAGVEGDDYGNFEGDDYGGGDDDDLDGADGWGDTNFEGSDQDLISAPRKVAQIQLNYARTSKQVDVKALKSTLWQCIGEESDKLQSMAEGSQGLSFKTVLSGLSSENVVGNIEDLSVHLCFICLLHLANENGLRITGSPTLDQVQIWDVPSANVI